MLSKPDHLLALPLPNPPERPWMPAADRAGAVSVSSTARQISGAPSPLSAEKKVATSGEFL